MLALANLFFLRENEKAQRRVSEVGQHREKLVLNVPQFRLWATVIKSREFHCLRLGVLPHLAGSQGTATITVTPPRPHSSVVTLCCSSSIRSSEFQVLKDIDLSSDVKKASSKHFM